MIFVTPLKEIEVKADIVRQQRTEEISESIYDEIHESGETLTPLTIGTQLHNSYLEVTNSSCNTININVNQNSRSTTRLCSHFQPSRQSSKRRHRYSLSENTLNSLKPAAEHYYSDGYLWPENIAQHYPINIMLEHEVFTITDTVAEKENDGHVYDEPAYDGIVRSETYDRLKFSIDVRKKTNRSMIVQNTSYTEKNQLANKYARCCSRRMTI